jgi:hypothetical protein
VPRAGLVLLLCFPNTSKHLLNMSSHPAYLLRWDLINSTCAFLTHGGLGR